MLGLWVHENVLRVSTLWYWWRQFNRSSYDCCAQCCYNNISLYYARRHGNEVVQNQFSFHRFSPTPFSFFINLLFFFICPPPLTPAKITINIYTVVLSFVYTKIFTVRWDQNNNNYKKRRRRKKVKWNDEYNSLRGSLGWILSYKLIKKLAHKYKLVGKHGARA